MKMVFLLQARNQLCCRMFDNMILDGNRNNRFGVYKYTNKEHATSEGGCIAPFKDFGGANKWLLE